MTPPPADLPIPRCPFCGAEMPAISYFSWHTENWIVLTVYCPEAGCHKTLHFQILPNALPAPQDRSRLV